LVFRIQPPDEFLDLLLGCGHLGDVDDGVKGRHNFEVRDDYISGETEHVVPESSLFSLDYCWGLGEVILAFTGSFSLGLSLLVVLGRSLDFNVNVVFLEVHFNGDFKDAGLEILRVDFLLLELVVRVLLLIFFLAKFAPVLSLHEDIIVRLFLFLFRGVSLLFSFVGFSRLGVG
jgi:hypothetical protein